MAGTTSPVPMTMRSCVAGGRVPAAGERSGLDLVASYDEAHENRGTGLSLVSTLLLSPFAESGSLHHRAVPCPLYVWRLSYAGLCSSRAGTEKFAYQNNVALTQPFDRAESYGQATFRCPCSTEDFPGAEPTGARTSTYDRPRASGLNLDSREYRYLLGVVWKQQP